MITGNKMFKRALVLMAVTGFSVPLAVGAATVSPANSELIAQQRSAALPVGAWSSAELKNIVKADDLKVSPFREDGLTYGTPTWVWCVEVDGALYVRAYNGQASRWYQAAVREKAGQVIAAGMTRKVIFEAVDGNINDRIDAAYRAKYSASPYLEPMIGERARGATIQIIPQIPDRK